ncbi:unnamed protein product [Citrullus colocynthis]|uniref:RNase H type-1 domain-containing protein n=1 Tax=Citrullus colocynthis TaxID=252529 RepID=A0ABP0Y5D0_9ROSI
MNLLLPSTTCWCQSEELVESQALAPPAKGWKMNSDASWSEELGVGGVGWFISDSSSSFIGGGYLQIGKHLKIKVLEMKAIEECLKALRFWFGIVIPPLLVESNSTEAIMSLYEIDSDLSDIKSVVGSAVILVSGFLMSPSGLLLLLVRLVVR